MTALPVAFRTSPGRYNFQGVTRLVNAYAEQLGQDAKAPYAIVPHDGMLSFTTVTDTPCRGMIFMEDLDLIYTAHSSSVWKVNSAGTATYVGAIPGIGPVQFSRNQKDPPQIVAHCTAGDFIIENDAVSIVNDDDLPDTVSADFLGGYTIYGIDDRRFFITSINESSEVDGTDFATFEQKAGKLIRAYADQGELLGFCSSWTERWRVTGQADFPFEPVSGTIQKGLLAPHAVVQADNTVIWPAHDGIVVRLSGSTPQRISTHDVERKIDNDDDQESIIAFTWTKGGHTFINFTGSDWSKCYDAATQSWSDRESGLGHNRWRAKHAVRAWGRTIVGDDQTGKLYYLDSDTFTENSEVMLWGVDSPPMHTFHNGGIVDAVHFDMATGVGLTSPTAQGYTPYVMLQVSKDGGNTWSAPRHLELGRQGKYRTRVTARRLGKFGPQGIIFRLRISDPVARSVALSDVDVRPLKL